MRPFISQYTLISLFGRAALPLLVSLCQAHVVASLCCIYRKQPVLPIVSQFAVLDWFSLTPHMTC